MNSKQARHCKAMAKKIREQAENIVRSMNAIESIESRDIPSMPITNMVNAFTHDMGYGVQDRLQAIERVIADMIGDLQPDNTNIGTSPDDTPQPPY